MAFRTAELDGKLVVIIDDSQLATAVKSLAYAWQEATDTDERVEQMVAFISELYADLAHTDVQDWCI